MGTRQEKDVATPPRGVPSKAWTAAEAVIRCAWGMGEPSRRKAAPRSRSS